MSVWLNLGCKLRGAGNVFGSGVFVRAASRSFGTATKESYDVLVVGGGVVGCNTARALASRGASVALLEQNTLTSGTTWHAAGLMGTLKGSSLLAVMGRYGVELYREMNDDAGNSLVGWSNTGSLTIARCEDSMEQIMRNCQMSHGLGHTHHRYVSPSEIKEIHPFLELDGIVGGIYSPEDGICNPADVAIWMAKEARESGAVVYERTECTSIELSSDNKRRASSARTACGKEIQFDSIAFCGGAWTKVLSNMAFGTNRIPVAMMPHQYIIFDQIEGVGNHLPVVRDVHHKYYLKPEVGGLCVGVFEGEPMDHLPDVVRERNANKVPMPRDAEHELYQESVDKAGRWLEACMEHCPSLTEVGIKQFLHGPDTHSVDHSPIIGRIPGSDNVYVATGFNSQGIQCGPGAGLAIAEYIMDGAPHTLACDFSSADPSRFFPALCEDADWVEKRAGEGYGKVYSIHYPMEIFESARSRRHSPLHQELLDAGAMFGETYGWERALYFPLPEETKPAVEESIWTDPSVPSPAHNAFSFSLAGAEYAEALQRECRAAREGVALFDLSSFGKISVSGPRAMELLQMCLTADMDKATGALTYSLFCDPRGGVLGDLTVARLGPEEFYLVTLANQPGKVLDQLSRVATDLGVDTSGCQVSDVTESKAILAVNGPRSRELLESICEGQLDNDSFAPYTAKSLKIAGIEVLALRVSFAGELGWELHTPAKEATRLHKALTLAGAAYDMRPAGTFALLESLRMEKGFLHYGADVSQAETPLEVGYGFACKLKPEQPDFVGKAAILAQRKEGWKKRLVSVRMEPGVDASLWGHEQELLYRNGERVGALTSGGYSYTLGCAIGMGFVHGPAKVPQKWLKEGMYEVEVPIRTAEGVQLKRFPVQVQTKCLVDPEGARVKGTWTPTASESQGLGSIGTSATQQRVTL